MYFVVVVVLVFCGWEVKWGVFLFCFVLCLPSISHFCVMKYLQFHEEKPNDTVSVSSAANV